MEWKYYHEGNRRHTHKLIYVKFDPAKYINDGVHDPRQIFCREHLQVQVKEHIGGLSPLILLDSHSIWMGKRHHKKILRFLARPIIGLGAQIFIEKIINYNWAPSATAKRPQINIGKGYPFRFRSRTIPVPTIQSFRRHQSCLLQYIGSNREILYRPNMKVTS